MRRAASASRTSGRYAVDLRPILDPDASTRRAQNLAEQPKRMITPPSTRLNRPRSFRDDLLARFAGVSDGRSDEGRVHPALVVLALCAAAVVAGMCSFTAIAGGQHRLGR